jgi:hypothetical protein
VCVCVCVCVCMRVHVCVCVCVRCVCVCVCVCVCESARGSQSYECAHHNGALHNVVALMNLVNLLFNTRRDVTSSLRDDVRVVSCLGHEPWRERTRTEDDVSKLHISLSNDFTRLQRNKETKNEVNTTPHDL